MEPIFCGPPSAPGEKRRERLQFRYFLVDPAWFLECGRILNPFYEREVIEK